MTHAMIDTETWGIRPGSALRSIGAVTFHPLTGDISSRFYRNISRESCERAGLEIDPETEKWWEDQSAEARAALEPDQVSLASALSDFLKWWETNKAKFFWSHGANFDEVLVRCAINAVGLDVPWDFWNVRCSRTVLALNNRKPRRENTTHHHALDDAIAQAVAVAAALRDGKTYL